MVFQGNYMLSQDLHDLGTPVITDISRLHYSRAHSFVYVTWQTRCPTFLVAAVGYATHAIFLQIIKFSIFANFTRSRITKCRMHSDTDNFTRDYEYWSQVIPETYKGKAMHIAP